MGTLFEPDTGRRVTLSATTSVGRSRALEREPGALYVPNPHVSSVRGCAVWRDDTWWIRDAVSSNGTSINGELFKGEERALARDDELIFGGGSEGSRWRVEDALPPLPRARCVGAALVAEDAGDVFALPDPADPQVMILPDGHGRWLADREGDIQRVVDQAEEATMEAPVRALSLLSAIEFAVSRDEEYVEVTLHFPRETIKLPSRTFHYTLLTIARARAADPQPEAPSAGWVYVGALCEDLGVHRKSLNVEIFRARKQLAEHGITEVGQLIERRAPNDQLRLGLPNITIGPVQ